MERCGVTMGFQILEEFNMFGVLLSCSRHVSSFLISTSQMTSTQEYPPLTTVYTTPRQCNNVRVTAVGTFQLWQDLRFELLSETDATLAPEATCYPSSFNVAHRLFSPGLSCPQGWYTVQTTQITSLNDPETLKFCCPR